MMENIKKSSIFLGKYLKFTLCERNCDYLHKASYSLLLRAKYSSVESEKQAARYFVDNRRIVVSGGSGGNGHMSFFKIPFKEWAGPSGGNGGNGGHVILKADSNTKSLYHVKSIISAKSGSKGGGNVCHGSNAEHLYVKVPLGTVVKSDDGKVIAELMQHDDTYIAARGGAGGKGNHFFLTNENRAPTVYEEGGKGERRVLHVEMSVIAHVGLIGFPNAGKSTLLRAISRAHPKVAPYAFTTLKPHVGIVHYEDLEQVAVADLPGLIPDAHLNRGLGFSFLHHIERCRCLLYVIDVSASNSWQQYYDLRKELDLYRVGLSSLPHAIVANKMDLQQAVNNYDTFCSKLRNETIIPVSAKHKTGLDKLTCTIRQMYDSYIVSE